MQLLHHAERARHGLQVRHETDEDSADPLDLLELLVHLLGQLRMLGPTGRTPLVRGLARVLVNLAERVEVGLQLRTRLREDARELPFPHRPGSALEVLSRIAQRLRERRGVGRGRRVRAGAELGRRVQHLGEIAAGRLHERAAVVRPDPANERLQRGKRRGRRGAEELLDLRAGARRGDDGLEQLAIGSLRAGGEQPARVTDESRRNVLLAGDGRVEVGELRVLTAVDPPAHLERKTRVRDARLRGGQDLGDAGEAGVGVERGESRRALPRKRPELTAERREQLTLMEMLLGKGIRPRLLGRRRHGLLLRD